MGGTEAWLLHSDRVPSAVVLFERRHRLVFERRRTRTRPGSAWPFPDGRASAPAAPAA